MSATDLYLAFPQWQGAGHLPELGAAVRRLAMEARPPDWQLMDLPEMRSIQLEAGVLGRTPLLRQLDDLTELLAREQPERIFMLAGDCAAELAPVSFLNVRHPDLTLLWLDAHADLNTPQSSPSGTLHGMPLRHLLGHGDADVLARLPAPLRPEQVVLAGVRDLDPAEEACADALQLAQVGVPELHAAPSRLGDLLAQRGVRRLYLHVDLDVLNPADFGSLGWPTPGGLRMDALLALLVDLHGRFEIVGGGLTEYLPSPAQETAQRDEASVRRILSAWRGAPIT